MSGLKPRQPQQLHYYASVISRIDGRQGKDRMVYFMEDLTTKLIKVGFSHCPNRRKSRVQYDVKSDIRIETCFPGTMEDEKTLHHIFQDNRVRGEWFNRTEVMNNWISLSKSKKFDEITQLLAIHRKILAIGNNKCQYS